MPPPFEDGTQSWNRKRGQGREQVLLCFAVEQEAKFIRDCGREILITGIGHENAERSLRARLRRDRPHWVLSCGFAGGLNPSLSVGTVVFSADENAGLASELSAAGARPVRFHSHERVATSIEEKRALWESTGADAVEMESGVIRAICRSRKIPGATVRVISDAANEDLPLDFNALMTAGRRVDYGRLARALLADPGKIPALVRLQRRTQRAARNLADILRPIIRNRF